MYILGKIAPKIKTQSRHLLRLPQISIVLSGIGRKHTEVKYRKFAIYCRGDDLSTKSLYISPTVSHIYETEYEIWTGFGLVGSTENFGTFWGMFSFAMFFKIL